MHGDRGLRDIRVIVQATLDLLQFDAVAAQLDLVIAASEEIERAVGAVAGEVAGPVQALPVAERIVDEAFALSVPAV